MARLKNSAFVVAHTGFEILIDEEARGDRRFGEPDGSFFARTGAIYKITSPVTGKWQQDYKNDQIWTYKWRLEDWRRGKGSHLSFARKEGRAISQ